MLKMMIYGYEGGSGGQVVAKRSAVIVLLVVLCAFRTRLAFVHGSVIERFFMGT